jgi:hypothetical protein
MQRIGCAAESFDQRLPQTRRTMYRKPKLCALATIGALMATVAGCGSSGGLSKTALVSKANAICTSTQKSAGAIASPANLQDPSSAAAYFDKIAPLTAKETSDLAALKPDASAAKDWNAFVAAQKSANDLLQKIKAKADAKDASGLQDLRQVPAAGTRVQVAATKVGATVCAQ